MIKIDKAVPIPTAARWGPPKYPWRNMKVGDSFFADVPRGTLGGSIAHAKRITGFRFACRTEGTGTRVWRTA